MVSMVVVEVEPGVHARRRLFMRMLIRLFGSEAGNMTRLESRGGETMSRGVVCCVVSAGADQARHWPMVVSAAEREPCARRQVRDRVRGWPEPLQRARKKERSRCECAHGRKGAKGKKVVVRGR